MPTRVPFFFRDFMEMLDNSAQSIKREKGSAVQKPENCFGFLNSCRLGSPGGAGTARCGATARGEEPSEHVGAAGSGVLRIVFAICCCTAEGRVYESFPYVAKQIVK